MVNSTPQCLISTSALVYLRCNLLDSREAGLSLGSPHGFGGSKKSFLMDVAKDDDEGRHSWTPSSVLLAFFIVLNQPYKQLVWHKTEAWPLE